MPFRLIGKDCQTLKQIAEYRILTVSQLAAMLQRKKQVIRRRLRDLEGKGLIEVASYEFGRGRGRPEKSISLTHCGVDLLKKKGLLCPDVVPEKVLVSPTLCVDHQLLMNWFRIHLNHLEKVYPRISIQFLAYNSPFLPKDQKGCALVTEYSPVPDSGVQGNKFIPDAVFSIKDQQAQKMCLFFLEVDRGTETLASPKREMTDIRQKIINYQWYLHAKSYKRYNQVFSYDFSGFRLLFLASTYGRLVALCKLTREMFPKKFIWLTECGRLFSKGFSAEIWTKGGDLHGSQGSILGSLCREAPLA